MKFNSLQQMTLSIEYCTYHFEEHAIDELTVGDVIGSYEGFLKIIDQGSNIGGIEREIEAIYDYHFNCGSLKQLEVRQNKNKGCSNDRTNAKLLSFPFQHAVLTIL